MYTIAGLFQTVLVVMAILNGYTVYCVLDFDPYVFDALF